MQNLTSKERIGRILKRRPVRNEPSIKKRFGDKIAFMGGLDVRCIAANEQDVIRAELIKKIPVAMEGGGYILHSDHSIPPQVERECCRKSLTSEWSHIDRAFN